jgi:hypothetical protein
MFARRTLESRFGTLTQGKVSADHAALPPVCAHADFARQGDPRLAR